ncbi:integrase arm-type DNA-binding domain-containing protein [Vibrio sp. SCSIO 43140]|uniref:integrase arm-type DNA-binding domain-containing protein n=1 Tax=Vibrio sp. SCSIO 43140 TaxID=2819100 RepID=UPI0020757723|nr:integrase arm-type DNA-binding domain-containing protein [Vibrio sp. SCSIO 43140]USD58934.1 integrase arm-type DNA-binding domain-containing protein [Vibrio sp. SCSIO 43140]
MLTRKDIECATAREGAYRLCDGKGLYLHVRPSGAKSWEFRYVKPVTGKPTFMGLGSLTRCDLTEARYQAKRYRALVKQGKDPQIHKHVTELDALAMQTLCVRHCLLLCIGRLRETENCPLLDQMQHFFERDVFPLLGETPVSQLTSAMLASALLPPPSASDTDIESAIKKAQLMVQVMDYAASSRFIPANPILDVVTLIQNQSKSLNP